MSQKVLAIINPKSGTSSKSGVVSKLIEVFADSPYTLYFTYTSYAGHASELAEDAAKAGFARVIAVGGDGTVNEVARGLLHTQTALSIIPMGSGNGLARALGLPMNIKRAAEIAANGTIDTIDCCLMDLLAPWVCPCLPRRLLRLLPRGVVSRSTAVR